MNFNIDMKKFLDPGKLGFLGKLFRKKGASGDNERTMAMPNFDDMQDPATADMSMDSDSITLESDAPAEKIKIKLKKPGDPDRARKIKLLALLLILLGGGYFAVSNDLVNPEPVMDSVMGLAQPVLEMAGLAEPPPPPPPAPAPKPRKVTNAPARPAPAARAAAAPKAVVASKLVSGTVDGNPFEPGTIEYMRGILVLREGSSSAPKTEIKLAIPHDDWELPINKAFESGMFKSAEITIITNGASSQVISKGADMEVKFGAIDGDLLAGNIKLSSREHRLQVQGSFKAALSGFYTVNGTPSLSGDANETLMYVALKHLLQKEPGITISNVGYRDARLSPANKPRSGSLVMEYAANNKSVRRTFEFRKTGEGWTVSEMSAEK